MHEDVAIPQQAKLDGDWFGELSQFDKPDVQNKRPITCIAVDTIYLLRIENSVEYQIRQPKSIQKSESNVIILGPELQKRMELLRSAFPTFNVCYFIYFLGYR